MKFFRLDLRREVNEHKSKRFKLGLCSNKASVIYHLILLLTPCLQDTVEQQELPATISGACAVKYSSYNLSTLPFQFGWLPVRAKSKLATQQTILLSKPARWEAARPILIFPFSFSSKFECLIAGVKWMPCQAEYSRRYKELTKSLQHCLFLLPLPKLILRLFSWWHNHYQV